YTLVLGVLNMLNLAQGEILTAGALVACAILSAGGSMPAALFASVLVCIALSLLVEFFCFRLPRGDTQVVTTIAMGMILQNVYTGLWGSESIKFRGLSSDFAIRISTLEFNATQILLLAITAALMIALSLLIDRSRFGREMRALSDNRTAARVSGVNIGRVTVLTFALSGLIAGISGVMAGMVFTSVTAFTGGTIGDKAMVAMVIGGTGSAFGAGIAGIILGIVEILSVGYLGAEYREIVVFPLLILFLWLRPSGIFGKGRVERA
ncbi:MAG: branched-chain amino acid ABC transporter permease, partial [Lachnospiraceae bacterium]|nr:branched-chain amino acid ABC transporter permease [Lachnospiraceae bacterium]